MAAVQRWKPPPGLAFKLNFDAAVFAETNSSGVRVVIRNNTGEIMVALSARGPGVADSSEEAEVLACRRALEFAVDAGFAELVIEGDNATVMRSIALLRVNNSRLGNIYEDVRHLAAGCRSLSISCVKHSANAVAHSLARYAGQLEEDIVWLEESPPPAFHALYLDSTLMNE